MNMEEALCHSGVRYYSTGTFIEQEDPVLYYTPESCIKNIEFGVVILEGTGRSEVLSWVPKKIRQL